MQHTFHIPVLGLGYSIDTPLKVAKFGISSVVSIVDDELTERMRKYHAEIHKEPFNFIGKKETDSRARRITAYLNLLHTLVVEQINAMKLQPFGAQNDLCKYFELLPEASELKLKYISMQQMQPGLAKQLLQNELKQNLETGSIDVNIMSKVDRANYLDGVYLGDENTDALAAVRGFASSTLSSSVIISAGLNPRLFSYMETLRCFRPDEYGDFRKKIILKVSDYRSASIQAKVLAKKGLWVSEFRIESGLNCGGHAFATDGFLLGPILQEFKDNRASLYGELFQLYSDALEAKKHEMQEDFHPAQRITLQGGIGTAEEHDFLIKYYQLDAAGWGSPFLLVPEATNVDEHTLKDLAEATESDFYLSNASPLGIPFNNFSKSTAEKQRTKRIAVGRPGSPCTKKYLCTNTEFTAEPICTASREYQNLKIRQLTSLKLTAEQLEQKIASVTEKTCLCGGLCSSAYQNCDILRPREDKAVSICPGPNLAYFSRSYSLKEMVDHIYGRQNILDTINRPNLFTKEFALYVDYFKKELEGIVDDMSAQKTKYLTKFYHQLKNGIDYYTQLIKNSEPSLFLWSTEQLQKFELVSSKLQLLMK